MTFGYCQKPWACQSELGFAQGACPSLSYALPSAKFTIFLISALACMNEYDKMRAGIQRSKVSCG